MQVTPDFSQNEREKVREVSQREHTLEGGQIRRCQTNDCFRNGSVNRQESWEICLAFRIAHSLSIKPLLYTHPDLLGLINHPTWLFRTAPSS